MIFIARLSRCHLWIEYRVSCPVYDLGSSSTPRRSLNLTRMRCGICVVPDAVLPKFLPGSLASPASLVAWTGPARQCVCRFASAYGERGAGGSPQAERERQSARLATARRQVLSWAQDGRLAGRPARRRGGEGKCLPATVGSSLVLPRVDGYLNENQIARSWGEGFRFFFPRVGGWVSSSFAGPDGMIVRKVSLTDFWYPCKWVTPAPTSVDFHQVRY